MVQRPVRGLLALISVLSLAAVLVTGLTAIPLSAASGPARMAALGDSITRGFNACGWYVDCPSSSWASGSERAIRSHYLRLRARNRSLAVYNDAVSKAKVDALASQAASAVAQRADYVTILIGSNDACTRSEEAMTSVADFETRFRAAMNVLRHGVPDALIFVSSIPDIKRLWEVGRNDAVARVAWTLLGVCRSMMFKPASTAAVDVARRNHVRRRVIGFNRVLAGVCAENPRCRSDGNAVFSYPFQLSNVSHWDFFHPNASGQAALAQVTFRSGYWAPAPSRHNRHR